MLSVILLKISKLCIWFYFGVVFYVKAKEGKLGLYIKNKLYIIESLTFFELFIKLFFINLILSFFIDLFVLNILNEYITSNFYDLTCHMNNNKNNNNDINNQSLNKTVESVGDSAIMATSISGAVKLAQKVPRVAGKIAMLAGGIGAGAGAIAAQNLIGNSTKNLGKDKFLPSISDIDLSEIFGLTGNSVVDLIIMIKYFQNLQLYLLVLITYYLIIFSLDLSKLDYLLNKIFPAKIVLYIKNFLNKVKKIGLITIISLIILCLIAAYLNSTYLDFLSDNLDSLIKLAYKNL
jgi:hypothetical protein